MADRSGGTVTIRLAVANDQAVRSALQALGRDGQRALSEIDAATKRPTASALALNDAMASLRGTATGYANQLGPAGAALQAFGTRGLVAAAGAAAVGVGLVKLGGAALQAGDRLGELQDRADNLQVSTDLLQALEVTALATGVGLEKLGPALDRLSVEAGKAAVGQGELYENLRRFAPEAATAIRHTTTLQEQLEVLARAFQGISDPQQRGALERAIFGRGGTGLGRMLAEAGGDLDALIAKLRDAGKITDSELVSRGDAFGDRIAQAGRQIETVMNPQLVRSGELMADIVEGFANLVAHLGNMKWPEPPPGVLEVVRFAARGGLPGVMLRQFGWTTSPTETAGGQAGAARGEIAALEAKLVDARKLLESGTSIGAPGFLVDALERQIAAKRAELVQLSVQSTPMTRSPLHDNLGPAAVPALSGIPSPWRNAQDILPGTVTEAEEARREAIARREAAERASAAALRESETATRQMTAAEEAAARVRAELGNVTGLVAIKERELQELVKAKTLTQVEATEALRRYREEQEKQAAAASAALPQLAALGQQAGDLKAQIDTGLTSSLRESASVFADITMGTVTFSEGLSGLARSIQKTVLELIYMKAVVGPLTQLIGGFGGGLFGGGGGGLSLATNANPMAYGGPRAGGGGVEAGKLYRVGERGEEWFAPRQSGTIIPNGGGGAPRINVNLIGAKGTEQVKDTRRNGDGSFDIDVLLDRKIDERLSHHFDDRSPFAQRFEKNYGLKAAM